MVIFHSYVSLPEGILIGNMLSQLSAEHTDLPGGDERAERG